MRSTVSSILALVCLACASGRGHFTLRVWDGGSEPMTVVSSESADPSYEIVMTSGRRGIEIPRVRQELNAYGRMNLTVWIRTTGRAQESVELKAKFFDASGRPLESAADWSQVFLGPGEAMQVELLCGENGATSFKVLVR